MGLSITKVKSTGAHYLDLGPFPVQLCFTPTRKSFDKELKRLGIGDTFGDDHLAFVMRATNADGRRVLLVAADPDLFVTNGNDSIGIACTLVHEAVHVWDAINEIIAADGCDTEMNAYHVEHISRFLMTVYYEEVIKNAS